jgi:translation initiation factor IF-3
VAEHGAQVFDRGRQHQPSGSARPGAGAGFSGSRSSGGGHEKEVLIIKRRFRPVRRARKQNVNEFIRAREVRVVFPDGETEVLPTSVGVRRAKELGLDLVLVSPTAVPPVCKVIDYGEFTYQEKKRKGEAKKKQHRIEVKEVKFRPNTDDHDYNFKKNHALRFLEEGNKVKATVFFRGREITHADLGVKLLQNLTQDVAEIGAPEGTPRLEGRSMHVIIGPKRK